jgi:polar amino acid transport system substrate-binding protein
MCARLRRRENPADLLTNKPAEIKGRILLMGVARSLIAFATVAWLGSSANIVSAAEAIPQPPAGQPYAIGAVNPAAPLYKSLPKETVAAGAIVTGIIIAAPPSQYIDPETKALKGFNIDLMKAVSDELGVPFKAVPTDFSSFIPGLQAHRFDMVAAFIADSEARQAVVDFVDYYATKDLALSQGGSTLQLKSLDDLCGHSIAIDQGNYLVPRLQALTAKCKADSRAEIRIDIFHDDSAARQAVGTGRSELIIASGLSAYYTVKTSNGGFRIASDPLGAPVLVGYPFLKGNDALRDVVRQAFTNMMASGNYRKILESWGLSNGALKEPYINAGPKAASIVGQ